MTEYGIQDDGSFKRKHVDDLQESIKNGLKRRAGDDIDLEQGSPAKQIVDMLSDELAEQWEAEEENYYTTYYGDAFGEQLDKLIALAGFSRIRRRVATGVVEFSTGTPNATNTPIPAETKVATVETDTRPALKFQTTDKVTLGSGDSSVTAPVRGLEPWESDLEEVWLGEETNVSSNTITEIVNPISGIDNVSNTLPTGDESEDFTRGRDRETDAELKLRYENSLAEGGVSTVSAMESNVFNAHEDIVSASVEEVRDTDNGYGPETTVLAPGVEDNIIAQAVFDSRAAGLDSFGNNSGIATRDDGREIEENFNRAVNVEISVEVDIVTSDTFQKTGVDKIRDKIVRYVGGIASDDVTYPGLTIGEDVIFDQVFRRVMEVQGVIEGTLKMSSTGDSFGESNIEIGELEAAKTDISEIQINE
jgi:uncharacterized phage protein gp47/JayE